MRSSIKLQRSIQQWSGCDPKAIATQSKAAITFAFEDAKADIAELAGQRSVLIALLAECYEVLATLDEPEVKELMSAIDSAIGNKPTQGGLL